MAARKEVMKGTRWQDVDWVILAQDREKRRDLVKTVMDLRFSSNVENLLTR
jgi:hypothetical protein